MIYRASNLVAWLESYYHFIRKMMYFSGRDVHCLIPKPVVMFWFHTPRQNEESHCWSDTKLLYTYTHSSVVL